MAYSIKEATVRLSLTSVAKLVTGTLIAMAGFACYAAPDETWLAVLTPAKRPTVTPAAALVVEGAKKFITVGDILTFTQRVAPVADKVRRAGFIIRAFPLTSADADPSPAIPELIDDCVVYLTTVIPVPASIDHKIQATKVDEAWLDLLSRQRIEDGYYLLVFESSGATDTVFRLHKDSKKDYFGAGLRLVVEHKGKANLQRVIQEYDRKDGAMRAKVVEMVSTDSHWPCYRYERFATDETSTQLAQAALEFCGRDETP